MYNKRIGDYGEQLAAKYLTKKGYKIINKNLKLSYKEIDIIANFKGKIVFIEVKTRTSELLGKAEDSMSAKKLHHLKKAISMYVGNNKNIDPNNIRLDLVCVDINISSKIAKIKHFEDLF